MTDLNLNEDGLAIIANGLLQYVTNETDEDAAYDEYAEKVGFDREDLPMTADHVEIRYIPADEMQDWEDADAENFPSR